jgi:hypothetical protein
MIIAADTRRSSTASLQSILSTQCRSESASASRPGAASYLHDSLETCTDTAYLTSPERLSELARTPKDPPQTMIPNTGSRGTSDGLGSADSPMSKDAWQIDLSPFPSPFEGMGRSGPQVPSPHAAKIRDEDLYEQDYDEPNSAGKRTALSPMRSWADLRRRRRLEREGASSDTLAEDHSRSH